MPKNKVKAEKKGPLKRDFTVPSPSVFVRKPPVPF